MKLGGVPRPALALGLAGLLPFWGLALLVIVGDPEMKANVIRAQLTYGAVILSFLGGIHWGLAVMHKSDATWRRLGWGVTPSLIAWGALFLPQLWGLGVLLTGFVAAAVIDYRIFAFAKVTSWFGLLRTILSAGAIFALLLTLIFGIAL